MTDDQLTAALDQLAAQREQITQLDAREAGHYATLTGLLTGCCPPLGMPMTATLAMPMDG